MATLLGSLGAAQTEEITLISDNPIVATGSDLPDAPSSLVEARSASFDAAAVAVLESRDESRLRFNLIASTRPTGEYSNDFQYREAIRESALFLSVQHGFRLLQPKTQRELGGPFFRDWADSVRGIKGWGDGDGPVTNYILHPGEGAVSSFIFIQNSPTARTQTFDLNSSTYWTSRLKALAFAAAYSTQFEIGPYSEATIGNVGLHPGTSGYVDFVMTPVGGFGFTVLEDWLDAKFIQPHETSRPDRKAYVRRMLLNPNRTIANLLRRKTPWHRDSR